MVHLPFKACIYENDSTLVEEKMSKGKKTLNASTGLGIIKTFYAFYSTHV